MFADGRSNFVINGVETVRSHFVEYKKGCESLWYGERKIET